jgi:hypothetical protein
VRPASDPRPRHTRPHQADRNGAPNPLIAEGARTEGTGIRHALALGVSQSGRFLRHFLELGMNDDGRRRRVFDGVMSHVAGAGKVFANHRFGMPGRTATQHEDRLYPENWFPFGNAITTDPFSRQTGAILRGDPTDPLVIETNSSTEYWQKGASLVHTDPASRSDGAGFRGRPRCQPDRSAGRLGRPAGADRQCLWRAGLRGR